MSLLPVGISGEAQYQIERSLRFNSADSAYLNRTPSTSNGTIWTFSAWIKLSAISTSSSLMNGYSSGTDFTNLAVNSDGTINFYTSVSGVAKINVKTTATYRDPSAWYHLVVAYNGTSGSLAFNIYINGVNQALTVTTAQAAAKSYIGNNVANYLGNNFNQSAGFNGYLTEINFIDGSALDPTSFGEFNSDTGVWQPKAYTGSYSGNSFYLNFSDNSGVTSTTLGKDSSGNGNNWTPNNFSVTAGAGNDSLVDTPTSYGTDTGAGGEVRGNYCTLNPFQLATSGALFTLANGNLDYSCSASTGNAGRMFCKATMALHSGKSYWEIQVTNTNPYIGVISEGTLADGGTPNGNTGVVAVYSSGQAITGTSTATYSGTTFTFTTNDIIGFAWDGTALTLGCYKNGSLIGTWSNFESTKTWFPVIGVTTGSSSTSAIANFGQRPFAYTAPSGFKALCTQNLPEPTIVDGGQYFNTVLWTGDGASSRNITGVGFQPDWVWLKSRSNATVHRIFDSVRGATKTISSNLTDAESTEAQQLTAFISDGFSLGSDVGTNGSARTFVAWNWKANGSGVSNTAGTITSTVSANTDSGFSIVTYTGNGTGGATIGHGLGAKPDFIIVKNRSNGSMNWLIYYSGEGANRYGYLNLTNAWVTDTTGFNNVEPTSTVFSVGTAVETNGNGNSMVAYAFRNIEGFSKISTYVGNGSADGPFVFTNFRPRWILIKLSSSAGGAWYVYDTSRNTYNVMDLYLRPDASDAENTFVTLDALSNGFKLRTSNTQFNGSGSTYIYMAFASNPFRYSLAA